MAKNEKIIVVERETFEKNGKVYFSYFIKGVIRGKEVKINIMPPIRAATPYLTSCSATQWRLSSSSSPLRSRTMQPAR